MVAVGQFWRQCVRTTRQRSVNSRHARLRDTGTTRALHFEMDGLVTTRSAHSPAETLDLLEAELRRRGITIFARIDYAQGAASAGLELRPTELLIFGNPQMGTRLMLAEQTTGIDLPLKVLAWLDAAGDRWLAYNDPSWLSTRYGLNADARRAAATMSETLRALLRCIGLVACVACAPERPVRQVIASPQAPAPLGAYSQAVRVGSTTYLAGQLPLDPATSELIADPSIEAQTRQALENLRAVLAADQMTLDNVVSTQVFVTDIAEVPRMNAVYATYFTELAPARAVVQVAGLARNARIEISAIAVK